MLLCLQCDLCVCFSPFISNIKKTEILFFFSFILLPSSVYDCWRLVGIGIFLWLIWSTESLGVGFIFSKAVLTFRTFPLHPPLFFGGRGGVGEDVEAVLHLSFLFGICIYIDIIISGGDYCLVRLSLSLHYQKPIEFQSFYFSRLRGGVYSGIGISA